jgi:hypothetical protein
LFAATSALAQTQPPPNPQDQIERAIGNLFVSGINLAAQLQGANARATALMEELAKAQAKIKELEAKTVPPAVTPAVPPAQ